MDKAHLKLKLKSSHDELLRTVEILSEKQCIEPPLGKWTGLQHIKHILLSISPVVKLLGNREKLFSRKFGESVTGSQPYQVIEEQYIRLLAPGIEAPQPFIPTDLKYGDKNVIFEEYNEKVKSLLGNIDDWSEEELDKYLIPHPLLGNLTLREMLYFFIYHSRHHQNNVERTLITYEAAK